MTDFEKFVRACEKWKRKLGLTDWRLIISRSKEHDDRNADVSPDTTSRIAMVRWFDCTYRHLSIDDVAKHEMIHVLLSDALDAAARTGDRHDPEVYREEHRLIERAMGVIQ